MGVSFLLFMNIQLPGGRMFKSDISLGLVFGGIALFVVLDYDGRLVVRWLPVGG